MMESVGDTLWELEEGKGMVYKKCRKRRRYQRNHSMSDKSHQFLKEQKM